MRGLRLHGNRTVSERLRGGIVMAEFRVLALDGGGIRGVFSAAFLAHIERHLSAPLIKHFDLITGTSTGSIIALGLVAGLSTQDILAAYKEADLLSFASLPR